MLADSEGEREIDLKDFDLAYRLDYLVLGFRPKCKQHVVVLKEDLKSKLHQSFVNVFTWCITFIIKV